MEIHLQNLLHELYESGQQNDSHEQERSKKMLNLEPDTAQLVSILIRSSQRKQLLEIGTSNGYSTIWLAWTARSTSGHVISIDRDEHKLLQPMSTYSEHIYASSSIFFMAMPAK